MYHGNVNESRALSSLKGSFSLSADVTFNDRFVTDGRIFIPLVASCGKIYNIRDKNISCACELCGA